MLGLSLGATKASVVEQAALVESLTQSGGSRGSGSAVEFGPFNVQGTLTFTENQTINSESGFLKAKYDTNQTNTSGIQIGNIVPVSLVHSGMFYKITFDLHLNRSSEWLTGAGNTTVTTDCLFGDGLVQKEVTPQSTFSYDTGAVEIQTNAANDVMIRFQTTNDLPLANAEIYIKNFTFKLGATAASVA